METTKTRTCTWIGQGELCTHTAMEHASYCVHHYPQIYQAGTAVRRKKDARRAAQIWDIESEFNAAVQELIDEGYDFGEDRWEVPAVEEL